MILGTAATGNSVLRNSIFGNGSPGGLGIVLNNDGVTANDNKDPDTGPNKLQNFPVITPASATTIEGRLNSRLRKTFTIQFFSNPAPNFPTGFGEGETFLGEKTVTTNLEGKVSFTFATSVTAGEVVTATATDASGNTSAASDTLKVTIDTGAPVAQAPVEVLVSSGNVSTAPTVPVKASWSASDAGGSGVSSYELQRSKDGGAFSALPPDATPTSKIANYQPVSSYQLRVRATDVAGNQSGWAAGPQFSVNLYQEDAAGVAYPSGVWTAEALSTALGGGVKYSGASGSKATFTFTGRQVGWVTNLDTNRGKAEVWVDGTRNKSSDLYRSASTPRVMTFVQDFGTTGTHTLEVRVLGTKNPASSGTRVDVDAFVVLN